MANLLSVAMYFVVGLLSGFPQVALACGGAVPVETRLATLSPFAVGNKPEATNSQYLEVSFAAPIAVLEIRDTVLRICVGSLEYWTEIENLRSYTGETVSIAADKYKLERSNLQFWTDAEILANFLQGEDALGNAANYIELRQPSDTRRFNLPVIQKSEIDLGFRRIEVVKLLLPISAVSLIHWHKLQTAGARAKPPVVIIDRSGSTAGFTQKFTVQLARALVNSPIMKTSVDAVFLVNAGYTGIRKLTFEAALSRGIAANSSANETSYWDMIENLEGRPILILAGGDVTLPAESRLNQNNSIIAAKLTPELDNDFEVSLKRLAETVEFIPFGNNLAEKVARAVLSDKNFQPEFGNNMRQLSTIFEDQFQAGFLPILPVDMKAEKAFPKALKNSRWHTLELWTVLNTQIFNSSNR